MSQTQMPLEARLTMKRGVAGQEFKKRNYLGSLGHSSVSLLCRGAWVQRNPCLILENRPSAVIKYNDAQPWCRKEIGGSAHSTELCLGEEQPSPLFSRLLRVNTAIQGARCF